MKLLLSLAFFIATLSTYNLYGQSLNIDNKTKFKDGIYATFEDFINNDPTYPFESFSIKWAESPYFNKVKIKSCKSYQDGKLKKTDMKTIWGICIGGIPYIQYTITVPYQMYYGNQATDLNGNSAFSRLRILGNICHFNIEDVLPKARRSRYRSVHTSSERSGKLVIAQRLLKFNTGKVYEYDEYVFSQLIKDDPILSDKFVQEDNRKQKMFLYLQEYNERNPVANRSILANNK